MDFINSTHLVLIYNVDKKSSLYRGFNQIGFLDISNTALILTLDIIKGNPYEGY